MKPWHMEPIFDFRRFSQLSVLFLFAFLSCSPLHSPILLHSNAGGKKFIHPKRGSYLFDVYPQVSGGIRREMLLWFNQNAEQWLKEWNAQRAELNEWQIEYPRDMSCVRTPFRSRIPFIVIQSDISQWLPLLGFVVSQTNGLYDKTSW